MKSFQSQTHYEVLEISIGASPAEVKTAFERLSSLYSDDQVALYGLIDPARATALRIRLKEALEVLTDDDRRDVYDARLGLPPRDRPRAPARKPAAAAGPSTGTGWGAFSYVSSTPAAAQVSTAASFSWVPAPSAPRASAPVAHPSNRAPPPSVVAEASPPAAVPVAEPATSVAPTLAPTSEPATAAPPAVVLESPIASVSAPRASEVASSIAVAPESNDSGTEDTASPRGATQLVNGASHGAPADAPSAPTSPPVVVEPVVEEPAPSSRVDQLDLGMQPGAAANWGIRDAAERAAAEIETPDVLTRPIAAAEPSRAEPPRPVVIAEPVTPPTAHEAPLDDEVVAIVPARSTPTRDFKLEARVKPYEVPPDVEFNGDLLKQVRMARGLSLSQLAERTRIGVKHLENLEGDRYDALPAVVYLRGILMNLARELGLDGLRVSKSYLAFVEAHRSKG